MDLKMPKRNGEIGASARDISPDTIVQQVLTNHTRQALLHLVRLGAVGGFRLDMRTTYLGYTIHFCAGGVWHVCITIIFSCRHRNCILNSPLCLPFWVGVLSLSVKSLVSAL